MIGSNTEYWYSLGGGGERSCSPHFVEEFSESKELGLAVFECVFTRETSCCLLSPKSQKLASSEATERRGNSVPKIAEHNKNQTSPKAEQRTAEQKTFVETTVVIKGNCKSP